MRRRSQLLLGGLLILVGVGWLLDTADVVDVWRWGVIVPLFIIGVGVWRILTAFGGADQDVVHGSVDTFVLLGDRHLRCDGPFEGGSVVSVLADVDLDLRGAKPASSPIELAATTILADLDIVVPASWRVRVDGPVILADVEVPDEIRGTGDAQGASLAGGPELVIRAFSVLGDLTVRRR